MHNCKLIRREKIEPYGVFDMEEREYDDGFVTKTMIITDRYSFDLDKHYEELKATHMLNSFTYIQKGVEEAKQSLNGPEFNEGSHERLREYIKVSEEKLENMKKVVDKHT